MLLAVHASLIVTLCVTVTCSILYIPLYPVDVKCSLQAGDYLFSTVYEG